jgi:hypothetical protein
VIEVVRYDRRTREIVVAAGWGGIHPDGVGLQDFKTRLPNAVERAIGTSQDRAI